MLVKCGLDEGTREIAQVFVPVSNKGVLWMLVYCFWFCLVFLLGWHG